MPATLSIVVLLLAAGVVSQSLWSPFSEHGWFDQVAYGLPSFAEGRWWTPLVGTFFVVEPWVYVPTLLAFAGMGYLEWRRGSLVALRVFWLGQLFAILATALFVFALQFTGWPWATGLAGVIDVGPSGGAMACIAAAVGIFAAPWRQRAWVLVFLYATVSLLFLGTLADVEHAFAILLILAIDRSFRVQQTTIPEQRMLAVATVIALGAIALIVLWLPTSGPFGDTTPEPFSLADALFDLVVVGFAVLGLRKGRRWGWLLALLLVALNLVTAVVVGLLLLLAPGELAPYIGDADVALASGVLWAAFGVFLVATRRAFSLWRQRPLTQGTAPVTVEEVRDLIRTEGGGTLSWMTTWERMRYLRTETGIMPYQSHAGVAIVLADPLGAPDGHATSIREFIDAAERNALAPCFFSASEATRSAMPDGWRSLVIADDTIVDLEGLTFTGKAWSKVRQSFSRADREGMTFRLTRLADEPFAVRAQLQAISEQWVGEKELPEMRFTLGTLQEAADPDVRLALAIDPQGNVDGMLSWLPVYGRAGEDGAPHVRGWTLDLMRRRDGGFGAVMEYLIGSSAQAFGEEGASMLSLSGAPLAHEAGEDEGVIGDLLGRLGALLEPVYGFRSLHRFKKKFNPRYEPIYLLYRDEGDLPAIGRGLTQAFLPDASLRQLASAGLGLVGSARTES
ncbi:DUF2156 domain-containing protein [Pseudoclavibacter endophyticus]|uniref:DUF2156 domain-containing protein n=2 Tax=Pseudoclavibacter endophyticus TaxID=1778590 RepID=A0A6H9WWB7_9MICO|nr:DUF2156 domain-containing protein [Pseudoclavibacter endophyticus]